MPDQLRCLADRAETDDLVTVRVIPFTVGVYRGFAGTFTLLESTEGCRDLLYVDPGRGALGNIVSGDDPLVAECRDDFEACIEVSLPEVESIQLIRSVADGCLRHPVATLCQLHSRCTLNARSHISMCCQ